MLLKERGQPIAPWERRLNGFAPAASAPYSPSSWSIPTQRAWKKRQIEPDIKKLYA
jgi:hypothetical protein